MEVSSVNPPQKVTQLLAELAGGRRGALDGLLPLVYDELAGWPRVIYARSAPATRSNPPRWFTKLICGWWIGGNRSGKTARISSASRRR
jgi:hypothetical protein